MQFSSDLIFLTARVSSPASLRESITIAHGLTSWHSCRNSLNVGLLAKIKFLAPIPFILSLICIEGPKPSSYDQYKTVPRIANDCESCKQKVDFPCPAGPDTNIIHVSGNEPKKENPGTMLVTTFSRNNCCAVCLVGTTFLSVKNTGPLQ